MQKEAVVRDCLQTYIMERLYLQTDRERLAEILPLGVWLLSPTLGQYEKQRYLSMAVEKSPAIRHPPHP